MPFTACPVHYCVSIALPYGFPQYRHFRWANFDRQIQHHEARHGLRARRIEVLAGDLSDFCYTSGPGRRYFAAWRLLPAWMQLRDSYYPPFAAAHAPCRMERGKPTRCLSSGAIASFLSSIVLVCTAWTISAHLPSLLYTDWITFGQSSLQRRSEPKC